MMIGSIVAISVKMDECLVEYTMIWWNAMSAKATGRDGSHRPDVSG